MDNATIMKVLEPIYYGKTKGTPRNPCLLCHGQHFNDVCEQYKLLADRKQRLSSFG